jgi:RES domain-containing protein
LKEPVWRTVEDRFWRMLSIRWQSRPLDSGSHLTGGRWNRVGVRALYLAADHPTAIGEFFQQLPRPGTLAGYDVFSKKIADLTRTDVRETFGIDEGALSSDWKSSVMIARKDPPGWPGSDALIEAGADGALVPSMQHRGGTNLVLWRWSADGSDGARVRVVDPHGDLPPA